MSSHRVTAKPRLLIAPRLTLAVAAAIQPIEASATRPVSSPQSRATQSEDGEPEKQPAQRYPGNGSRGHNAIRRHWISIFSSLMLFVGSAIASGDSPETHAEGLAFRTQSGWQPTLALDTAVDMQIRGLIAEVTVRQTYVNDSSEWQEGRYLLPLPSEAAVGSLRVSIGERLIVGEVREKEAARQIFAEAASSGRNAALVEQDRPNLFRTAVTNIGPGEKIAIEIGYWQAVSYSDHAFSITLPLTLTPRFVSSALAMGKDENSDPLPSQAIKHSDGIEPTVSLTADLQAGVPLLGIDSVTHRITVTPMAGFQRVILTDLVELADRDFELRWKPLPSTLPQRAVFTEEVDGEHYALLMLLPPTLPVQALPREMILVVDNSGSMLGAAMEQAIAALDAALLQLTPRDYFNVIRFSDASERLFAESMPVNADSISHARAFVAALYASGGTEMAPALSLAFEGAPPAGMVRQVVLATDAAIGNEAELLNIIETQRGQARLFPVAIGSAPNSHFIRKAAEMGRGSQALIRDILEVTEQMQVLFARLNRPVLHDLEVTWPDAAEIYPPRLPDLYAGEPLQIVARLPVLQGEVSVIGQSRDEPWRSRMRLDPLHAIHANGVGRLWGRARIESIEDAMRAGLPELAGRPQIVETALQHGLASRFTSLIAVERTPVRPSDAALAGTHIPNAAPADSVALAQGSTSARSQLGIALTLALMAGALVRRRERIVAPGVN
ncbi:MAG: marine proteobacterial sortase target protein [Pseudomarimonas sp.]